ncbi:MAG TPA: ABC transporter permease [Bryobacteraceae bacterium]|nr:ABC transporter permease [Bryobacteraceae bacterium]
MKKRLKVIMRKELIQALRDPRMRTMLILPPILQLIIFGYAANLDVDFARIAWMDRERTPESRELMSYFVGSGRFQIVAMPAGDAQMQRLLDHGDVDAAVRILPGFSRDVERGRTTSVQVLVDGTNSNTASIVANYATQAIGRYSTEVLQKQQADKLVGRSQASGGPLHANLPQLDARPRVWFNPDLKSRNYFVPGVVVNIITLVTLMLTAMAIVREKEIGTMEQLMVTPIQPIELMLGKTLPFAMVGLFDVTLAVSVALALFHIPFRGSAWVLLLGAVVFLMTSLGAGLFISTVSRTQQQAMMSTFLFFQPFFLLSGFTFPIRNMPVAVQYLTFLNPVRYFLEIVRGIFLKGSGVSVLWPQLVALAIIGVSVLTMSALRFHKKLD